jgi:hypothetical protein
MVYRAQQVAQLLYRSAAELAGPGRVLEHEVDVRRDRRERVAERGDDGGESLRPRTRPVRSEVRVHVRDASNAGNDEVVLEQAERTRDDLGVVAGEVDQVRRVDDGRIDPGLGAPDAECRERGIVDRLCPVRLRVVAEDLNSRVERFDVDSVPTQAPRPVLRRQTRAWSQLSRRRPRSRNALAMTETELNDIASAATTGLSKMPNVG